MSTGNLLTAPPTAFSAPERAMRLLLTVAGFGAATFVLGIFVAPTRAWGGFLMGFTYFTSACLAGGLFLTVLSLSSARWAQRLQRIPEAMTHGLPLGLLLGLVLVGGVNSLYEWSHADVVAADPLLQEKSVFLNTGFFLFRMVLYFGLWIGLTRSIVAASRRFDRDGDRAHRRTYLWRTVAFLPVFALTYSLASIDWLQSLEPHWFSTIYALVTLSGLGTSGLAACIVLVVLLRRTGHLRGVATTEHLDDLGKVACGLALFWGYIWYCQYMLVWYTNMPEETPHYALRMSGNWHVLTWASVTLNWAVPFFALMPRAARRSGPVLLRVAAVMLVGNALQLYLLVAPPLMGAHPALGIWEIGPVAGALALFFWSTLRGLERAALVPRES